jgi:hypothetical protein
MPDENRVFDVSKPGRGAPSPTSKPVIVGHQPRINDPMVNKEEGGGLNFGTEAPATKINVHDEIHDHGIEPPAAAKFEETEPAHDSWIAPAAEEPAAPEPPAPEPNLPPVSMPEPLAEHEPSTPSARTDSPNPAAAEPASDFSGHVEGLHLSAPKKKGNAKYAALGIIILLIAAYLAIDSGAIGSGINLPFHVFKQKTAPAPAASSTAVTTQSPIPAGFTKYNLTGTSITFDAPVSWGQPSSTLDPGFSARGGTNQSDGTYAYLVDFASNKDVEIAVTSSKFLPAARASLYYDFLQWCVGTNDSKFYLQSLHFTTSADKVDSPATVSCDQGPIGNAQKLDSATLLMPQVKAGDGKTVIGDIYVKNLSGTALPVFRVKDAAGKNGTEIKQLLSTIKTS